MSNGRATRRAFARGGFRPKRLFRRKESVLIAGNSASINSVDKTQDAARCGIPLVTRRWNIASIWLGESLAPASSHQVTTAM